MSGGGGDGKDTGIDAGYGGYDSGWYDTGWGGGGSGGGS
ncbi:MAG TPA: single-stranded DNA-binding protein, partial [Deltaproteobacteria bacterium]|nr:single-stranded DNA-binding protein [Deltaproteobacteria bacterium]